MNNLKSRLFIGSLVERALIYHPSVTGERNKRKRNRLLKRYKQVGIIVFMDHLFREAGSNDNRIYRTMEACMESMPRNNLSKGNGMIKRVVKH